MFFIKNKSAGSSVITDGMGTHKRPANASKEMNAPLQAYFGEDCPQPSRSKERTFSLTSVWIGTILFANKASDD
jgi:hypothetical protein